MKKLLTIIFLISGICSGKSIDHFQFKDKYENILVSCAGILPASYDKNKAYSLLIAEPGDGEKLLNGSTPTAVSNLLNKSGQAGCEYLKSTKEYEGILVTFIVPFQPSELKGAPLKGRLLSQVVEQCKLRYKVSRVSMTGLSSGGADVWQYISAYPTSLYAAVPIACWQYGQTSAINRAVATGGTKIWQIQNASDYTIGAGSDENLSYFMNELVKLGLDGKMTVLNKSGHDTWEPVYKNEKVPVLSGTLNTGKLSPLPEDVWAFLFGTEGTKPDTIKPFPVDGDTAKGTGLKVVYSYPRNTPKLTSSNGVVSQCYYSYTGILDTLWNKSTLPPVKGFPVSDWQMIATGSILFPYASAWEVKIGSDDGNKLVIGGDTISSDWKDHAYKETSKAKQINPGKLPISFSYYNACCGWEFKLMWRPNAWSSWEVVPRKYLYTN